MVLSPTFAIRARLPSLSTIRPIFFPRITPISHRHASFNLLRTSSRSNATESTKKMYSIPNDTPKTAPVVQNQPPESTRARKANHNRLLTIIESVSSVDPVGVSHTALKGKNDYIEAYLVLRKASPTHLHRLHPLAWTNLAQHAIRQKVFDVVNTLARDVLNCHYAHIRAALKRKDPTSKEWDYRPLLAALLRIEQENQVLKSPVLFGLCKALLPATSNGNSLHPVSEDNTQLPPGLTARAMMHVVRRIVDQPAAARIDTTALMKPLIIALNRRAEAVHAEKGERFWNYCWPDSKSLANENITSGMPHPNDPLWLLFRLIQILLGRPGDERKNLVYMLLQVIVRHEGIPSEAIQLSDEKTVHFETMTLSTLIRTCVIRGWSVGAADLLKSLVTAQSLFQEHIEELSEIVIHSLLQDGTLESTSRCNHLISLLVTKIPSFRPSDALLEDFYAACCRVKAIDRAAELYLFLRSRELEGGPSTALPKCPPLLWLLQRYVMGDKNQHGARILAQHIVSSGVRLPRLMVPSIITLCAKASLVDPSRQLWERFSQGPDKNMVTGNSKVMLSLVSLFVRRGEKRLNAQGTSPDVQADEGTAPMLAEQVNEDPKVESLVGGGDSRVDGGVSHNTSNIVRTETITDAADRVGEAPHEGAPDITATSSIATEGAASKVHPPSTFLPRQPNRYMDSPIVREDYPDSDSDLAFAHRVLHEFELARAPFDEASHIDVNALARGMSLVGDMEGCLNALKIIINRREIPDLHDINIVVGAFAENDPRRAAKVIERMIQSNVVPDGVTFATVMHHALNAGEHELAGRLFDLSRSIGIEELTSAAIARLVETHLKVCSQVGTNIVDEEVLGYLQRILALVSSSQFPDSLRKPHLGVRCIRAAIRHKQAVLAFRFWKLLVKERVDASAPFHSRSRFRIAREVRRAHKEGVVSLMDGHRMASELGMDHMFMLR